MKTSKVNSVFLFLLVIPYLCTLALIGIAFNALVLHSASLWRTVIGALVGAMITFAIKGTVQRPLDLVSDQVNSKVFKQFLRFFSVRRRKFLQLANFVLDFALCGISTYLVRQVLTIQQIVGNSIGYVLVVMLISTAIGAYIEYDALSIDPSQR